jgi:hypothetical protein
MSFTKKIVYSLFVLPFTIIHELLHFIVGFAVNARPYSFSIIPDFNKDEIVLGSVSCSNIRWYNGFFVGLAPLLIVPIFYYVFTNTSDQISKIVLLIISVPLLRAAIPSKQDIKVSMESISIYFIIGIYLIYRFF